MQPKVKVQPSLFVKVVEKVQNCPFFDIQRDDKSVRITISHWLEISQLMPLSPHAHKDTSVLHLNNLRGQCSLELDDQSFPTRQWKNNAHRMSCATKVTFIFKKEKYNIAKTRQLSNEATAALEKAVSNITALGYTQQYTEETCDMSCFAEVEDPNLYWDDLDPLWGFQS